MAKLGLESGSPALSRPSAIAPACFSEPPSPFCAPGAGIPSSVRTLVLQPRLLPGLGASSAKPVGSQRGLLASAGVGLVTGMRSLLTSGWGGCQGLGTFALSHLSISCMCGRKTNLLVGTLHLACGPQAWGSCWATISPWAVPSHRFPGEWLCVEKELGPGAGTCC